MFDKTELTSKILKKLNSVKGKKAKFNKGDLVHLTLKGLQKFNKQRIPGKFSNEYSQALSKLYDNKAAGKVEHVFPSGSMNVRFGKTVFDIKPYMVEKA